jgi:hypothetical protein
MRRTTTAYLSQVAHFRTIKTLHIRGWAKTTAWRVKATAKLASIKDRMITWIDEGRL